MENRVEVEGQMSYGDAYCGKTAKQENGSEAEGE